MIMKKLLSNREDYEIYIDTDDNNYIVERNGNEIGRYKTFESANKHIDNVNKQEKKEPITCLKSEKYVYDKHYYYLPAKITSANIITGISGNERVEVWVVDVNKSRSKHEIGGFYISVIKDTDKNKSINLEIDKNVKEIDRLETEIKDLRETYDKFTVDELKKYFALGEIK